MRLLTVCASAFVFGFVGSMPLAGPIAIMLLSRAAGRRFGEALRIGLGASVAEGLYAGTAFWGFTALLGGNPLLVPLSRGATAVVLVGLGARFVFWRPKEAGDLRESKAGTVLLGFTVSALNPTLLFTWSAATAFLNSRHIESVGVLLQRDAIPFGLCAGAGIACWFVVLVALLRRYHGQLPRNALAWTVRILGVALVALGIWSGVRLATWFLATRRTS
jgi:threonine/homoserine/homoserine lactone efflux protein